MVPHLDVCMCLNDTRSGYWSGGRTHIRARSAGGRACPLRARSRGLALALTVTQGTNAVLMTCMYAGLAEASRNLPSWWCRPPRCSIVSAASAASRPRRHGV